jgi:hypothetical protein
MSSDHTRRESLLETHTQEVAYIPRDVREKYLGNERFTHGIISHMGLNRTSSLGLSETPHILCIVQDNFLITVSNMHLTLMLASSWLTISSKFWEIHSCNLSLALPEAPRQNTRQMRLNETQPLGRSRPTQEYCSAVSRENSLTDHLSHCIMFD